MAEYTAELVWERGNQPFVDRRYSRKHILRFDGGVQIPGSSSPWVVPAPLSDPTAVDPEELFVASLASCHMLWFLATAAERGFCVDRYTDCASGLMTKDDAGRLAITEVTLRPHVVFSGLRIPGRETVDALHLSSHEQCFIANSVRTRVRCEPIHDE